MMHKNTLLYLAFLVLIVAAPPDTACIRGANEQSSPRSDGRSIEDLIRQLGSSSFEEREQASERLTALGGQALEALRRAGKGNDAETARRARACVTVIERKMKIVSLAAALRDSNPDIRREAASSLIEMGLAAAPAVPALLAALDCPDPGVREKALLVLRSIGSGAETAVPKLIRIANNKGETTDLRWWAVIALGAIPQGSQHSLPVLLRMTEDKEPLLRMAATNALGSLGREGKRVVPVLIKLLHDPDQNVQGAAAGGLGSFPLESSLSAPALLDFLTRYRGFRGRDDPRLSALWAFLKLGPDGRAAVPALIAIAENHKEDRRLRTRAIAALGKMGPEVKQAGDALRRLAENPDLDYAIKLAVSEALGIGPE